MDLERMTARVRPRKGWEAIDLGVALVQQHAKALYKIWFIVTLPIYLLAVTIFHNYSIWPFVFFWLLLPIWERPMLHFLSRELFGERLRVNDCVKQFFQLAKVQWFPSLSWRRMSFTRSLDLPVIQLEGLTGSERSQRLRVIHSIGSGAAVWLTIFFVMLELIFYFSFFVLAYLLLPQPMTEDVDFWGWVTGQIDFGWIDFSRNLLIYLAVSLVAPFYTACGFALYLNQRTHLEAWDIELSFRRLAKRLSEKSQQQSSRLATIGLVFIFSSLFFSAESLYAAESSQQETQATQQQSVDDLSHQSAKELIKAIKDDEDFKGKEQTYRHQPRFDEKKEDNFETSYSPWWGLLGKGISILVEFALWVVLAVVVLFLVLRYRHLVGGLGLPESKTKKRPKKLFGLDLDTNSLPDKPWEVALKMIQAGDYRQATSLLYRSSLIWYIDNTPVVIKEGDTELECLRKIKLQPASDTIPYMAGLTSDWRRMAYAHQLPEEHKLIEFCQQWPQVFQLTETNEEDNER